jgi:hypothetical protein
MACMNLCYYLSCGVHVYLIYLVICDELCLSIITDSCHNDHTCVGTLHFFLQKYMVKLSSLYLSVMLS